MRRFILGWVSMSFVACAATAGQAQTGQAQIWVADEIRPPYVTESDGITGRGGPYPRPGEKRGYGLHDDSLHPFEIVRIIRATGYEPLGPAVRRRWVYTISAINPEGDDGRVVLDARTGRIMRFIPAEVSNDEIVESYGQPGLPPPPEKANARTSLRPPLPVPHVARRTPATTSGKPDPRTVGVAPSSQQPASLLGKPADARPGETRPSEAKSSENRSSEIKSSDIKPVEAKPPLQLRPTQDMPAVQALD